jgi:hypothetical protein
VNQFPICKEGFYGTYNSLQNGQAISRTQKFDEDRIILLEGLSDRTIFYRCLDNPPFNAFDELTKGIATFRINFKHPLWLDFAAQLFLDSHHVRWDRVSSAWNSLQTYVEHSTKSIKLNLTLHEKVRNYTWSLSNDKAFQMVIEAGEVLISRDTVHFAKVNLMRQSGLVPEGNPYALYTNLPWLCGCLLFGFKVTIQQIGYDFANAWGSIKYTAQIYNAVKKEKPLDKKLRDMELSLFLFKDAAMFIDTAPNNVEDYLKRFDLSIAYSAQTYAKVGKRPHSKYLVSSQGPRGLISEEVTTPISCLMRCEYTMMQNPDLKINPNLDDVLQKCLERETGIVRKNARNQNTCTSSELIGHIAKALQDEELALYFDTIHMHRIAFKVLQAIKSKNDEDFKNISGPMYIENGSQLPFLAGYIFMAASSSKKLAGLLARKKSDVVTSKLLVGAASILDRMIESGISEPEKTFFTGRYDIDFEDD